MVVLTNEVLDEVPEGLVLWNSEVQLRISQSLSISKEQSGVISRVNPERRAEERLHESPPPRRLFLFEVDRVFRGLPGADLLIWSVRDKLDK